MKKKLVTTLMAVIGFSMIGGCATIDPNRDEQAADMESYKGNYGAAVALVQPHAEAGEPWAQLRLGIMYEGGSGVRKDVPTGIERYERTDYIATAIEWYKKAAAQKATGKWAEGVRLGASGSSGYFNQNNSARIAQYHLANLYLKGEGVGKDLEQAYLNIRAVVDETKGEGMLFCCEFAEPSYITAQQIDNTYKAVLKQMSDEQKRHAEDEYLRQLRDRKK